MATGKDVLKTAICELGTKESPAGSNNVKYNTWYYGHEVHGTAYPWCMVFVQWCYTMSNAALPFLTASCGTLLRWYRENQPECITETPEAGDIVIFDLPNTNSDTDHTGIFERWEGQYIVSIDGNTGTTNDANGGAVMRRTRLRSRVKAYIHPKEIWKKEDEPVDEKRYNTIDEIARDCPWAVPTVQKLFDKGILRGDSNGMDLSRDMLRLLVINDRAGLYG